MQDFPQVEFTNDNPPECLINGRPVRARDQVRVAGQTVFVLDLVRMYWRQPGRTQPEIDAALAYIAAHLDGLR